MTNTFTFDIDHNTTIDQLLTYLSQNNLTLISINPQPDLPLPSITVKHK